MLGMIFLALHSCDSNCLMDHGCFVCLYMQGNRKKEFQICFDKNSWIILWQIERCFIMHLRNLKKLVGIFRLNSYLGLGWNSSTVFCNSVEASRVMQVLNCRYLVYVAVFCFVPTVAHICFQEARKVYEMLVKNSTTASSLAYIQVCVLEGEFVPHGYWKQLPN